MTLILDKLFLVTAFKAFSYLVSSDEPGSKIEDKWYKLTCDESVWADQKCKGGWGMD